MDRIDTSACRQAWEVASDELGIRVQTRDCWLEQPEKNLRHELVAIICDFGGDNGMLVLEDWDPSVAEVARSQGYGYTVLGSDYETYNREIFEETLNDWQWTGQGDPPPRYTGIPWGE